MSIRLALAGLTSTVDPEVAFQKTRSSHIGPGRYPISCNHVAARSFDLHDLLNGLALAHWQIFAIENCESDIQEGIAIANDLFFGDWPKSMSPDWSTFSSQVRSDFRWLKPMMRGLLLSALGQQWNDVDRLLSWLDLDLQPEYLGPLEPEVGRFYILVASHLRNPRVQHVETIVDEIKQCKSKRPRMLLDIWKAIQANSQPDFDQAMLESLSLFAKTKFDPKSADFTEAIAIPQSFLNLLAVRLGLRYPSLPDHLTARLITPESIGIG